MPKKSFAPEQIVTKLREIDVLTAQAMKAGISGQSDYRWRKEYGGLDIKEGLKVPKKYKPPWAAVVERRLLHPASTCTAQPRLKRRLRNRLDTRRPGVETSDLDR